MGYCIDLMDANFFIAAENKEAALNALFDMWLPNKAANMSGGSWGPGVDVKYYSWMNNSAEAWRNRTIESLEEGMEEWEYPVYNDEYGNIVDIGFYGEKIGDEDQMFAALAPFVRAGSYLDFHGEDGALWRWFFDGTRMVEKRGRVEFD